MGDRIEAELDDYLHGEMEAYGEDEAEVDEKWDAVADQIPGLYDDILRELEPLTMAEVAARAAEPLVQDIYI
jgi:hypothetical protein